MILSPFINFLATIISFYSTCLFGWIVIGILIRFNIINSYSLIVRKIMKLGAELYEPALSRIRKIVPPFAGIDLSPVVLILILNLLQGILFSI